MPRAGIVSEVSEQSCRNLQVTCCHCAAHSYAGIEDETVGSLAVDCAVRSQHMDAQVIRRLFSAMPFERAQPLLESLAVDLNSRLATSQLTSRLFFSLCRRICELLPGTSLLLIDCFHPTRARAHTHKHTSTHSCMHARTHACTHARTHGFPCVLAASTSCKHANRACRSCSVENCWT